MITTVMIIMTNLAMLSMRGMRGSRGSYTPRGGGVATSQQTASGLVISNVSDHDDDDHDDHHDDHHDDYESKMLILTN